MEGKKKFNEFFLQVFCHYFFCIATVNVLQFRTFFSDHCVFNKFYSNTFTSIREKTTPFMQFSVNGKKHFEKYFLQVFRH